MSNRTWVELYEQCRRWNEQHPVGTVVDFQPDGGERIRTRTASGASVHNGNRPVIWLDGVKGSCDLERVTVI